MSPAMMLRVLELTIEAEALLRLERTPETVGHALGCLATVRCIVEASVEVAMKEAA